MDVRHGDVLPRSMEAKTSQSGKYSGATLRARVQGTERLNTVLRTTTVEGDAEPGSPRAVAAAELELVEQDARALALGEVERSVHAIDAGAAHLASGNQQVAAEIYRQEAERIRSILLGVEPVADRSVLDLVAENLESRSALYGVEASHEARRAGRRAASSKPQRDRNLKDPHRAAPVP